MKKPRNLVLGFFMHAVPAGKAGAKKKTGRDALFFVPREKKITSSLRQRERQEQQPGQQREQPGRQQRRGRQERREQQPGRRQRERRGRQEQQQERRGQQQEPEREQQQRALPSGRKQKRPGQSGQRRGETVSLYVPFVDDLTKTPRPSRIGQMEIIPRHSAFYKSVVQRKIPRRCSQRPSMVGLKGVPPSLHMSSKRC